MSLIGYMVNIGVLFKLSYKLFLFLVILYFGL